MIKDIILGWLECFGKNYFVVGYVLEAPQNKSQKLFWGVTLVILPRVACMLKHHGSEGRIGPAAGSPRCLTLLSELPRS